MLQLIDISALFLDRGKAVAESSNALNHLAKVFGNDVSISLNGVMTKIFRTPLAAIAAAATMTAATAAQPAKTDRRPPASAQALAAPVVLAAATEVRGPSTTNAQRPVDPAKRRIARVTTCRCGDPQPDQVQEEQ